MVALLTSTVGGCAFVSGTGPTASQIRGAGESLAVDRDTPSTRYAVVEVDLPIARALSKRPAAEPAAFFGDTPPDRPQLAIGTGDEVAVTIVNTSQAGFVNFAQSTVSPLATTSLPPQPVMADGRISVPPLGRVAAIGRTPQQLERELQQQLGDVLVDPSVIVRLTDRRIRQVAVMGIAVQPGYYPILAEETRILDVLAAAGGPDLRGQVAGRARRVGAADENNEIVMALNRGGVERRIRLDRFLADPALNIRVWPGDVIRLEPAERRFTLLGALGANGDYGYVDTSLTLAQALARGGGLVNQQAARNGVFIYRSTPRADLQELAGEPLQLRDEIVPTVYSFDFSQPDVMLAAQRFAMRDGDMVYVPDSPLSELSKVLGAFNAGLSTASRIAVITD
jgi:polysaccharide export outer membrane protein